MRLIDADAVLDMMNSQMDMQELYLPIQFKELVIDQLPTAYDVDKVVAELKKESKSSCGKCKARFPYIRSKTIFCEQCATLRAIRIVKGGGVDGE